MMLDSMPILIGIDVGGTFTDACAWDGVVWHTAKVPTTPADPVEGVLAALGQLSDVLNGRDAARRAVLIQGSTIATNALLERKGARTALITSAGFRDVLRIGRQERPRLYDLHVRKPLPIVAHDDVFEVNERIDAEGNVMTPLDEESARQALTAIRVRGIENVAVSLLFSYLDAAHEEAVSKMAAEQCLSVSRSSEILPEFREFERTSTTAINAYVAPLVRDFYDRLTEALSSRGIRHIRVMQSNGGQVGTAFAGGHAVRTILSGPAGGVVAGWEIGKQLGEDQLITYDMGGTSTDVALCSGEPTWRTDSVLDGWPVRVPMMDIHTIGAGGGSIARVDEAGALVVGPESAGADPGPACYGKSDRATVTDANVVLGLVRPGFFLGGKMTIDLARSEAAVDAIAQAMQVDRITAAVGIIRVANANMERAIKAVSAERGHDPRRCALVCFGGAGGLHACALAGAIGMASVILPADAGILSATGMLQADIIRDYTHSIRQKGVIDLAAIRKHFADMMDRAARDVFADGYDIDDSEFDRYADMRYKGQSYELTVPVESLTDHELLVAPFHAMHKQRFGHATPDEPVEIVTLRGRCRVLTPKPTPPRIGPTDGNVGRALIARYPICIGTTGAKDGTPLVEAPFYDRARLLADDTATGPAVIIEPFATAFIPRGWAFTATATGHIRIRTHVR